MKTTHINAFSETLKQTLEEIGLEQKTVSQRTGIPESHLSAMKHGTRRITAEYDCRLSRFFGTTEGFWLRLQLASDIRHIRKEKGQVIEQEVIPLATA